jgi:hypothetical protein
MLALIPQRKRQALEKQLSSDMETTRIQPAQAELF